MSRRNNDNIIIADRIELFGCGERSKNAIMQKLRPTVRIRKLKGDEKLRPSCNQSVSVSDNYVLIERISILKQLPNKFGKMRRFEERRSFHCPQRTRDNRRSVGRAVQSENALDKSTVFNLYGPLNVISNQEVIAASNCEYTVRETIELRTDGSTQQPERELIPFKGEVKQPNGKDAILSACKYDERIHIGQNVILIKRDITIPPSHYTTVEQLSFTDSRTYSTDTAISSMSTTSDGLHSPLPRLSECTTARSPADFTSKSPTLKLKSSKANSPADVTAKSPTYATAKSSRSFGCFSPISPIPRKTKKQCSHQDAISKEDEPPIKLFDAIEKTEKGITAMESVRDYALLPPSSRLNSSLKPTNKRIPPISSFRAKPTRSRTLFVESPLNVAATTPPSATVCSIPPENQTDPYVRSTPKTPPLDRSFRLEVMTPERSPPRLRRNAQKMISRPSEDVQTAHSPGTNTCRELAIKDKQQMTFTLLKHFSDARKHKDEHSGASLLSKPEKSEQLATPSGPESVARGQSSKDRSKDIKELSRKKVKDYKKSFKEGAQIKNEQKLFNKNVSLHKSVHNPRVISQQISTQHVEKRNGSSCSTTIPLSVEVTKNINATPEESQEVRTTEFTLPHNKRCMEETVLALEQAQQLRNVLDKELKTNQRTGKQGSQENQTNLNGTSSEAVHDNSTTSSKEEVKTATLLIPLLHTAREATKTNETLLKRAREVSESAGQLINWSKAKSLSLLMKNEWAKKAREISQIYGKSISNMTQRMMLKTKHEDKLLGTAREPTSENDSNRSFSTRPRNETLLRTTQKQCRINGSEGSKTKRKQGTSVATMRKYIDSNEEQLKTGRKMRDEQSRGGNTKRKSRLTGEMMKGKEQLSMTCQDKSDRELERQPQLMKQKTIADEIQLNTAREKNERKRKRHAQHAAAVDEQLQQEAGENVRLSVTRSNSAGVECGASRTRYSKNASGRENFGGMKPDTHVRKANEALSGVQESPSSGPKKYNKYGNRKQKKHRPGSTEASDKTLCVNMARSPSPRRKKKLDALKPYERKAPFVTSPGRRYSTHDGILVDKSQDEDMRTARSPAMEQRPEEGVRTAHSPTMGEGPEEGVRTARSPAICQGPEEGVRTAHSPTMGEGPEEGVRTAHSPTMGEGPEEGVRTAHSPTIGEGPEEVVRTAHSPTIGEGPEEGVRTAHSPTMGGTEEGVRTARSATVGQGPEEGVRTARSATAGQGPEEGVRTAHSPTMREGPEEGARTARSATAGQGPQEGVRTARSATVGQGPEEGVRTARSPNSSKQRTAFYC
ncbi:unnamed protein product [Toxocara canis]|uniref:Non-specific serine/threonine protein kinase n=1 Tax=Toxocara canis TaxID=6265 RepID=A0A183UE75_TOXCA|nr:unnamed protein product [Toxocara canis]